MILNNANEKYVATSDIIGIASLALRWPYRAVHKIPLQIFTGYLNIYKWHEELQLPDGRKIHRISLVNANKSTHNLASMMPNLVFCLQEIETIENNHSHYTATRPPKEHENKLLIATNDNIHDAVNTILNLCEYIAKFESTHDHGTVENLILNGLHKIITHGVAHYIDTNNIFPVFSKSYEQNKTLTTFDLAKEFVKRCAPQTRGDELLALLEVDRRFPGLTQDQIASLFPPPSRTENSESLVKHVYRLRSAAYKYQKITFDLPVH